MSVKTVLAISVGALCVLVGLVGGYLAGVSEAARYYGEREKQLIRLCEPDFQTAIVNNARLLQDKSPKELEEILNAISAYARQVWKDENARVTARAVLAVQIQTCLQSGNPTQSVANCVQRVLDKFTNTFSACEFEDDPHSERLADGLAVELGATQSLECHAGLTNAMQR